MMYREQRENMKERKMDIKQVALHHLLEVKI